MSRKVSRSNISVLNSQDSSDSMELHLNSTTGISGNIGSGYNGMNPGHLNIGFDARMGGGLNGSSNNNPLEDPITALMNASSGGFNRNNSSNVLDKFRLAPPLPATTNSGINSGINSSSYNASYNNSGAATPLGQLLSATTGSMSVPSTATAGSMNSLSAGSAAGDNDNTSITLSTHASSRHHHHHSKHHSKQQQQQQQQQPSPAQLLSTPSQSRGGSTKMVCGSQYRMPQRAISPCENCDLLTSSNKKQKETIRGLKLQITRLEEQLAFMNKSGGKMPSVPTPVSDDAAAEEITQLKAAIANLNKKYKDCDFENGRLRQQLQEAAAQSEDQRRVAARTLQVTHEQLEKLQFDYNALLAANAASRDSHKSLHETIKQLQDINTTSEGVIKDLKGQLAQYGNQSDNSDELERLRQENKNLTDQLAALKHQLSRAVEEADTREQKLLGEKSVLETGLEKEKEKVTAQEVIVREKSSLIEHQKEKITELEEALQQAKRGLANSINEKNVLSKEVQKITTAHLELQEQHNELNQAYNDLCKKMMKEADITAKALDKAISSSVRLCVVAPTVNVHISDKKMKFQSKTSETELRKFLEDQVLSKFVFLYNQEHDDIAPDGKTPLREWVTRMLSEMQGSIESHINNAMKGAAAGAGGGGAGGDSGPERRGSRGESSGDEQLSRSMSQRMRQQQQQR